MCMNSRRMLKLRSSCLGPQGWKRPAYAKQGRSRKDEQPTERGDGLAECDNEKRNARELNSKIGKHWTQEWSWNGKDYRRRTLKGVWAAKVDRDKSQLWEAMLQEEPKDPWKGCNSSWKWAWCGQKPDPKWWWRCVKERIWGLGETNRKFEKPGKSVLLNWISFECYRRSGKDSYQGKYVHRWKSTDFLR